MEKCYHMTDAEFEAFLESIGGLENGYFSDRPSIKSAGFFSVSAGWYGLIKELIEDIIAMGWDKQICQVKEKFGGLRFYINSASKEVHDRISEAEKLSYRVCEKCGNPGEHRSDRRWMETLCDTHADASKNN
jgi:hypothetical protein